MEANKSHLQTFGCHVALRPRNNRESKSNKKTQYGAVVLLYGDTRGQL